MANPADYPRKIRYSGANCGVQEVFALDMVVEPEPEPERYAANDPMPGADDEFVARILEAIGNTDEMQFIRKLMAEAMPPGQAGGECAGEDPAPVMTPQMASQLVSMAQHGQPPAMLHAPPVAATKGQPVAAQVQRENYRRTPRPLPLDPEEKYSRKMQAHADSVSADDDYNQERKGPSERIAQYAMEHHCDWETAEIATGLARAHVHMVTATPV